jgi:hypothetical protein
MTIDIKTHEKMNLKQFFWILDMTGIPRIFGFFRLIPDWDWTETGLRLEFWWIPLDFLEYIGHSTRFRQTFQNQTGIGGAG